MECNYINNAMPCTVIYSLQRTSLGDSSALHQSISGLELLCMMHFHTTWIGLLATLPSALGFWPIYYTESSSPYRNDAPTVQVETLFQFPNNGSWIDNLALRSDGSILLTRLDT